MEYASKGIGTAGLTTGIIGTALSALGGGAERDDVHGRRRPKIKEISFRG